MEATDPVIGLRITRSDVAFIHDVLMSCQFSGAQMLQASGIIAGLRPALAVEPEAQPQDQSTTDVHHNPNPHPEARAKARRPAKRKR